MATRLARIGIVLAALAALALPAAASASPQLFEAGAALAKGATVGATSKNTKITKTALGTLSCGDIATTVKVKVNSGAHVETEPLAGAKTTCAITEPPNSVTVTKPTFTSLTTADRDEGLLGFTFVLDIGAFECHFEGTGRFHYTTKTDVINVGGGATDKGIALKASSELCLEEEGQPPVFHGDFTLTTENGTAVTIE